ncbi:hypothetical protein HNR19_001016 [Nocardioides thalensis]|uniref:Ig-like domain (Group 3) n=1 Tax=Nocardioides thalensis TaxID=1914755 RepID=A0A853C126_9ACTN|nr:Ig-like domain-containing protein [Nocardioides thalensis]NYJ00318.1 hypothetical protein [Nocardioides thalensis]
MTLRHSARARLRTVAAGTVLGLAAASASIVGTAPSASAATLSFDCTLPLLGVQTFSVDISHSAPSQLPTGSTTTPDVTAVLNIPAGIADAMRTFLSVEEVAGTIQSAVSVDGVTQAVPLTIPRTDGGDAGEPAVLTATGALAPITGGDPGDVIEVVAGNQDVAMTLYNAAGEGTPFAVPCTPTAGQDLAMGTISVVKAGSSTKVAASYSAKRDKVTGTATVKASNGIATTGQVKFILKKGTKTLKTVTRALRNGKATASFLRVKKAGAYTLVAQYAGSDRVKASSGKDGFRVR